jgi:hypothetical protein
MKPLADGSKVVGLFNLDWGPMPITVDLREIGAGDSAAIRDLWARRNLGVFKGTFTATVPKHGVVMIFLPFDQSSKVLTASPSNPCTLGVAATRGYQCIG